MKVLEGRWAEAMLLAIPVFTIATLMFVNVVIFLVKKLKKVRKQGKQQNIFTSSTICETQRGCYLRVASQVAS